MHVHETTDITSWEITKCKQSQLETTLTAYFGIVSDNRLGGKTVVDTSYSFTEK